MKNKQHNNDYQPPTDALYRKPWFIALGVIAVLSMIGYIAFLG
ncbi:MULTISPECIES: hypothetical protein [Convivina]|uniref:Uncharacterized protein n=2 Tax=Convivina TaxID=1697027 RepID=A0A2U1D5Y9_9LACO|nr:MULTISPECIES: hypothetical protein [Convivina]SDB97876.1 hypothetical protein SAMN05216341_10833 [Leuconostocaceae bacterium R-53105]PVY83096.1 hypothetical protein C7384_10944 [Convivina intestini]CAH1849958.1 hypothetical protein R078138_00034 [Convivina sp. LMG 32447]CAH1856176.1 hypothetical protein LMG032447_01249 [Convivina sp. LMG 32447]CAH1856634.1 hypothetical protein R077811_01297 [Convivina intestini]